MELEQFREERLPETLHTHGGCIGGFVHEERYWQYPRHGGAGGLLRTKGYSGYSRKQTRKPACSGCEGTRCGRRAALARQRAVVPATAEIIPCAPRAVPAAECPPHPSAPGLGSTLSRVNRSRPAPPGASIPCAQCAAGVWSALRAPSRNPPSPWGHKRSEANDEPASPCAAPPTATLRTQTKSRSPSALPSPSRAHLSIASRRRHRFHSRRMRPKLCRVGWCWRVPNLQQVRFSASCAPADRRNCSVYEARMSRRGAAPP